MSEKEDLFEFKKDGKTVKVYKGKGTSDVYYKVNDGSSTSAGLKYNGDQGNFKSGSGSSLTWEKAKELVRDKI